MPDSENDIHTLAEGARALIAATADVTGEKVVAARKSLAAALERGREFYDQARDKAVEGVHAAEKCARRHPYQLLGIAFGIGAVVGLLVSRRGCGRTEERAQG